MFLDDKETTDMLRFTTDGETQLSALLFAKHETLFYANSCK